jgi:hypothetical protein
MATVERGSTISSTPSKEAVMPRFLLYAIALTLVSVPWSADAAEVSGSLLYDDQPVTTVFADIQQAIVTAFPAAGGTQLFGTVDLATSTYRIDGLAAAEYNLQVQLIRADPSPYLGYPGDLTAGDNVEPADPGASRSFAPAPPPQPPWAASRRARPSAQTSVCARSGVKARR